MDVWSLHASQCPIELPAYLRADSTFVEPVVGSTLCPHNDVVVFRASWRRLTGADPEDRIIGWLRRGDVDRLCRKLRRRPTHRYMIRALTWIMTSSPDPAASVKARHALAQACAGNTGKTGNAVLHEILECFVDRDLSGWPKEFEFVPSAAFVSFLFAPLPDPDLCSYLPTLRVVEAAATMRREQKLWLIRTVSRGPVRRSCPVWARSPTDAAGSWLLWNPRTPARTCV
ncbi:hypothetical protein [Nocardia bovistercoris]|uniref:Uncharacterized protein n=1 Tax=Nocardia bovistercoris TaxID=2785916 RepID=A0A931N7J6_9NOCA|nr:hypothetical protein [Nocardia bovistercoris]MBH0781686.1 hypothetical protein [Nocardia bovistercoris]